MFKNMGGNIPGWDFPGGNSPGRILIDGDFPDNPYLTDKNAIYLSLLFYPVVQ